MNMYGVQLKYIGKNQWLLHGTVDAWIRLDSDDERMWQVLNNERQSVGHYARFDMALSHAYSSVTLTQPR